MNCQKCGRELRYVGVWKLCPACNHARLAAENEQRYASSLWPRSLSAAEMKKAVARAGLEDSVNC